MTRRQFGRKMSNRGSALLTVILVVGFLTILATTLLYVSGMEFQTKQADYLNKKSFYSGEEALEEIRAKFMEDASIAAIDAYNHVTMQFVTLQTKDMRQLEYNTTFVTNLLERLNPAVGGTDDWREILRSHTTMAAIDPSSPTTYELQINSAYAPYTTTAMVDVDDANGFIRIKGLKMIYTNPDTKIATIISTDLDICAPAIDWSAEGALTAVDPPGDSGAKAIAARSRTTIDASKCVKYANWKKE